MFFSTSTLPTRHTAYTATGRALERLLEDARSATSTPDCAYQQDGTGYALALDIPGITKDQLSIAIDGAVVRIQSKEPAPRRYRTAYEFPQEIDASLSSAVLENGVLNLKLVKKVPMNNATELTIQ